MCLGFDHESAMRILIYGFGPYGQFQDNITARIVRSLTPRVGLKKKVFPVRFRRSLFIDALKRHKPDVVLGMGQCERKHIEIESRAANRKRLSKGAPLRSISKVGRRWLPTTLEVKIGGSTRLSKSAGNYVCNYSMYVISDYLLRRAPDTKFGFIHIPFDFDAAKAAKRIGRFVGKLYGMPKNRIEVKS